MKSFLNILTYVLGTIILSPLALGVFAGLYGLVLSVLYGMAIICICVISPCIAELLADYFGVIAHFCKVVFKD